MLWLDETELNKEDIAHLTHLIGTNKLPQLEQLKSKSSQIWCDMEDELHGRVDACFTNHQRDMTLSLSLSNLSKEFKKKFTEIWERHCKEKILKVNSLHS